MINQLIDDHQQTPSPPFLDQHQHASFVSRCSTTIIQCKFNLMMVQLNELQTFVRHHHSTLSDLQEKLSQLHRENSYLYTTLFMNSTEERRQAMITRLFQIRQHKLKTFLDGAPMMDVNSN